jgi:hypothetical protein
LPQPSSHVSRETRAFNKGIAGQARNDGVGDGLAPLLLRMPQAVLSLTCDYGNYAFQTKSRLKKKI